MFEIEVEFIDPEKDRCAECGCGLGIHMRRCSQFFMCPECRCHTRDQHFRGCSQREPEA